MEIALFIALFVLSGFGSLYEVVILSEKSSTKQRIIQEFNQNPKRVLLFLQIFITACNLAIGILGEILLSHTPQSVRFASYLVITMSVVMFAEILPKQFGFFYSRFFLETGGSLVYWVYKILSPLVIIFDVVVSKTLALLRFRTTVRVAPEELETLKSTLIEVFREKSPRFLQNAMTLITSLSVVRVADVLIPRTRLRVLEVDSLEFVDQSKINASGFHLTLVKVGTSYYVPLRQLKSQLSDVPGICQLSNPKSKSGNESLNFEQAYVCDSTDYVLEVIVELNSAGKRIAVCLDEFGSLDGVFDPSEVLTKIHSKAQAKQLGQHRLLLPGTARLSLIPLMVDIELPSTIKLNRTLESLFLEELGPDVQPGSQITLGPLTLVATCVNRGRVETVETVVGNG